MATTAYLPYATAGGANVLDDADYAASSTRTGGAIIGLADPTTANKAWRQSSMLAAAVTQFIADTLASNIVDDGDVNALKVNFENALNDVINADITASYETAYSAGYGYTTNTASRTYFHIDPDGFVEMGGFVVGTNIASAGATITFITFPIPFPSGQAPVFTATLGYGITGITVSAVSSSATGGTVSVYGGSYSFAWRATWH